MTADDIIYYATKQVNDKKLCRMDFAGRLVAFKSEEACIDYMTAAGIPNASYDVSKDNVITIVRDNCHDDSVPVEECVEIGNAMIVFYDDIEQGAVVGFDNAKS